MRSIIICLAMLIPSVVFAGDLSGPTKATTSLAPGEMKTWIRTFEGGVFAEVSATGNGGDIDCAVIDELTDKVVLSDTDRHSSCFMVFMPQKTGKYRIRVINSGKENSIVTMETN